LSVQFSAKSGYDPRYPGRSVGPAAERSPGGYYLNAAQKGEPPGRWFGRGAEALGLASGSTVDAEVHDAVFEQVDPRTGEKLGRGRQGSYEQKKAAKFQKLLAAEPWATAERRRELWSEAASSTYHQAPYTDTTANFSKSISVLHASIRENERRARIAGDTCLAAWWDGRERRFQEILQDANRAALAEYERFAATRTGYHGAKVDGHEQGKWEATDPVVSSWLQGTSRDGDPHDHVHNLVARMSRTASDGKWRAVDTKVLAAQLHAMAGVAAAHVESALSHEFGVEWTRRKDGAGNEISGVTQEQMDAYSSRRETIVSEANKPGGPVDQFRETFGRDPNQRELSRIMQSVAYSTRDAKDEEGIDWDAKTQEWDAALGGQLAGIASHVAPSLRDAGDDAQAPQRAQVVKRPSMQALARAAQQAVAALQQKQATWTRADLMKQLSAVMPAQTRTLEPEAAVALLHEVTNRALAGEFEPVACLEAPVWPQLPAQLIREVDGRSVYTRPGTARYSTRAQLTLEERLVTQAQRATAPYLTREVCATQLGADADTLEAQLAEGAEAARDSGQATGCGLRLDQAAALQHLLTSPRLVEVLVGPAGSGKTRTLAEATRIWRAEGPGRVFGTTSAQAARNVLAAAAEGMIADNTSIFLGHLPGQRGALGVRHQLRPGDMLLIDESTMISTQDFADLVTLAERAQVKVIVAGDPEQLQAVEGGGWMGLIARTNGYSRLAEAVRFKEEWERKASLDLRAGEASALQAYDAHGRIHGGSPEQVMEDVRRHWLACHLDGKDVHIIASERDRCRELSRRIRDDLIHLGEVDAKRPVRIADGAQASAGDLILARRNDHRLVTDPGHTLANGDIMRVETVNGDGTLTVRRATGEIDPQTGRVRYADQAFTWRRGGETGYQHAELAYASTGHRAIGSTVGVGLPLFTGSETRQQMYAMLTRGGEANHAYVCTQPKQVSDPAAGTRPAPELERAAQLERERAGLPPLPEPAAAQDAAGEPPERDALAVLADILGRDGTERAAIEIQRQNLVNADHLGKLNAMWMGETTALQRDRYTRLVKAAAPDADLDSAQATWLWRTLRSAEAAGLDAEQVIRRAVESRSLAGARDHASVIDARIRPNIGTAVPSRARKWAEQAPQVGNPEMGHFLHNLADAMDARKERLGEHAAEHPPGWAPATLGPVPEEPLARLDWQQRASEVAAYRELYGWEYDRPCDSATYRAIGPEPHVTSPEQRAAWHAAYAAMNGTDAVIDGATDGTLLNMRAAYERETAWAPPDVADVLRQERLVAVEAESAATRAAAMARVARERGDEEASARHEANADTQHIAARFYREREAIDALRHEDRREWLRATEGARNLAVQADSEWRRRHPGEDLEPLRNAEPEAEPGKAPEVLTSEQAAEWAQRVAGQREAFRAKLDARREAEQNVMVPDEDPDWEHVGEAFPSRPERHRDAILQPPKPELEPAPAVLEAVAQRDAQPEAE
jgi:conjugative relaxase-like TrwC/TraI family protein